MADMSLKVADDAGNYITQAWSVCTALGLIDQHRLVGN